MAQRRRSSSRTRAARGGARPAAGDAAATGGRALWSGSISFGLLQIPIALHSAERRGDEIHFRLLDRQDLSPIRNVRVNAENGRQLEWKDIVKGYEYEPGQFVTVDDEDLKRANVAATQTIDIQDFVPAGEISPAFFETPYYAVPTKRSAKAYALLRDALRRKGAAAVATFVLRTREHLCALLPVGDAIMVEVLRFGHELRPAGELPLPAGERAAAHGHPRELEMAERLIEEMMGRFDPRKYKDRFHDDVLKMIERKVRTGKVRAVNTRARGEVASNVVDLMALLKKSVARQGRAGARKAA